MKRSVSIFSALLVSTLSFHVAQFAYAEQPISAGEYQAILGDCAACHGANLAGGMAFPIPVGEIYATNITPDKTHGIGNYTLTDFINVMRNGVTKDGHHLYPAMPYTAYAKMSDADLEVLYQYLMQEVQPQAVANTPPDISWPLNMRWPLAIWKALFHDAAPFVADASKSAEWNRGAYLVQGAAHCGTCHTPRGIAMQEKALTDAGTEFLSGAELAGWYAGNIRGNQYSEQDIITLLDTGRSQHQAVLGPMAEVITHSSQYFTDADLKSIAVYVTQLSSTASAPASSKPLATVAGQSEAQYRIFCITCHGNKGQGTDNVIPALAGNDTVLADNPASLINILLNGGSTATTQTHIGYLMPGYGWVLEDQQVADLANLLRASWGNQAAAVTAAEVAKQRKQ